MITRPICPHCNKEMVFVVLPVAGEKYEVYACDCQNPHIVDEITEARVDPSPDASIVITYSIFQTEEPVPPTQSPEINGRMLELYCPN